MLNFNVVTLDTLWLWVLAIPILLLGIKIVVGGFMIGLEGWKKTKEFITRALEIIEAYKGIEKYLMKKCVWTEAISFPSSFYDEKFQTSEEAMKILTTMVADAIDCYDQLIGKRKKRKLEELQFELLFIQRKIRLFTFGG